MAFFRMLSDGREIMAWHGRCAMQRMGELPVVLCLNDTTELDFNDQTIEGVGR
jgi:hypothetical protein